MVANSFNNKRVLAAAASILLTVVAALPDSSRAAVSYVSDFQKDSTLQRLHADSLLKTKNTHQPTVDAKNTVVQDMAQATPQTDSIRTVSEGEKKGGEAMMLDADVQYEAKDSMRFDFEHKKMYLYGDAKIDYGDISLTAYAIELDMDSSLAYAHGLVDSLGVESGLPVFKDKSGEYEMRSM